VLNGGTPAAGRVAEDETLASEKTVNTDDMLTTLQENNKNLLAITGQLMIIAGKINQGKGAIGLLLNDRDLADRLRRTAAGLQTASEKTVQLSDRLNSFAGQLNSQTGLAYRVATDTTVFRQLQETMTELRQSSAAVAIAAGNIQQASTGLERSNTPAGLLLKDESVAKDLKITIGHLRSSTEKLDEDLEAMQHNVLLKGYFNKKAKAAQKDSLRKAVHPDSLRTTMH
jgi:phospholipid/cholesterol/gamma-HCH transport system substrate-binding protein